MAKITIEDTPTWEVNADGSETTWVKITKPKELIPFNADELLAAEKMGWTPKVPNPAIYTGPKPNPLGVPLENMIDNPLSALAACHLWVQQGVASETVRLIKQQGYKQVDENIAPLVQPLQPYLSQ